MTILFYRITTFRFHTGSIKRIMMRDLSVVVEGQFRFHTGSIKRESSNKALRASIRFRFHTGSIKRKKFHDRYSKRRKSFDSILVRLKDCASTEKRSRRESFDSILVRLKVNVGMSPS